MAQQGTRGDPKHRLDRDGIISAAVEDLDRGTLEDLSMRRLADRLGVTPMALYRHVADKDEIIDEILDLALRRDATPHHAPRPKRAWLPWLIRCNEQLRALLLDHPALLDRYLRAPVAVPAALERMEAVLAVLVRAGFSDDDSIAIYASAHTFTLGFTALEVARRRSLGPTKPAPDHSGRQMPVLRPGTPGFWPLYLGTLSTETFPHLSRIRPDLAEFSSPARFVEGLTDLLSSRNSDNS